MQLVALNEMMYMLFFSFGACAGNGKKRCNKLVKNVQE